MSRAGVRRASVFRASAGSCQKSGRAVSCSKSSTSRLFPATSKILLHLGELALEPVHFGLEIRQQRWTPSLPAAVALLVLLAAAAGAGGVSPALFCPCPPGR